MTEQEAREKWCPMVRFNYCGEGVTDNNRANGMNSTTCIASDCMMWRWEEFETCPLCNGKKYEGGTAVYKQSCKHQWERNGLCGLAGGI